MSRLRTIWKRLSKREKGLVLLSLAILALLIGRALVYEPFVARMTRTSQQLELEPQRLERNLRYVNRKPEIMANLERARGELKGLEPLLLTGDTPSVSASDLQRTVQDFASRGGTQVVSTRVLSPEAMGPFPRIPKSWRISSARAASSRGSSRCSSPGIRRRSARPTSSERFRISRPPAARQWSRRAFSVPRQWEHSRAFRSSSRSAA